MLGSIGLSEWVAASITIWLALQVPLGMVVGFYLRRTAALNAFNGLETRAVSADLGSSWQDFMQGGTVSTAFPALRFTVH